VNDQNSASSQSVCDDLGTLLKRGLERGSIERCDALIGFIERHIVEGENASLELRSDLLEKIFRGVTLEAACRIEKRNPQAWELRKSPDCQVVAAAELLGLKSPTWEKLFNVIGTRVTRESQALLLEH